MKQTKLYINTVSPLLLESFYKISKIPNLKSFRLVGGIVLSLLLEVGCTIKKSCNFAL